MKRCPLCDKIWEADKLFCPKDGHRLKTLDDSYFRMANNIASINKFDPQFELFSDPAPYINTQLIEPIETPVIINDSEGVDAVIEAAESALQRQRKEDAESLRDQIKLFDEFNNRCRAVQFFINNLLSRTSSFVWKAEYLDEWQRRWIAFQISFGEGRYLRTFPITITYHRAPRREVTIEIDLYEIGQNKDQRQLRAEKAGGKVIYSNITGYGYILKAPQHCDCDNLLKWLERSFTTIFKLAYGVTV